jgi:hypothetical protein
MTPPPRWAGWAKTLERLGPAWKFPRKINRAAEDFWAENKGWLENYFSNFSNKDLSLKVKDSNAFKPNLN